MRDWNIVKNSGVDILVWWEYMVKKGIKELAREKGIKIKKQRIGKLNMLKIKQAYFNTKVSSSLGDHKHLTDLMGVNITISKWYESESENINLFSRAQDINLNEKVRIFHHGLHKKCQKRSMIMQLSTPNGTVEGHSACAKALEDNVENHLLNPAPLDPFSQNLLLAEILPSFTEEDNEILLSLPSKQEVHNTLKSCRPH